MLGYQAVSGAKIHTPERVRRSLMRRLWMVLLLVAVIVARVASAAWASPATSAARSAPAARTAPAAAAQALQPGMKGSAVKALQRRLAALKYYPGSVAGRFGPNTPRAAVAV